MNPRANKKRPAPQDNWQEITLEIIGEFRRRIHERRFLVDLATRPLSTYRLSKNLSQNIKGK